MRIIFFTQEDPFYVKIFFDEFFANYKSLDEIKAVVISKAMGKKSLFALAKQMYGLYGIFNFLRIGFKFVFYKLMSKRKISKPMHSTHTGSIQSAKSVDVDRTYSIKQLCDLYGIQTIERSDINSESFISMIKTYNPDLFISVACPIIFKQSLINIPKLDCINIHNAPLPKYRGMLPNFWQLYHREKNVGITVHRIQKGIDTGDIIIQEMIPIIEEEPLDSLIKRTKRYGAHIISKIIQDFQDGHIKYRKMLGEGSYFSFPTRSDVKKFYKMGNRIL